MPASILEQVNQAGTPYRFGDIAVRIETGDLVVVTGIPPQEGGYSGVNVAQIDYSSAGEEVLRASGTFSLSELRRVGYDAPWSVDKAAARIAQGEFGPAATQELIVQFREIFEQHAKLPAVIA